MGEIIGPLIPAVVIGVGATALLDLWTLARRKLVGAASLDYGLVGRWLIWMTHGRFRHDPIAALPSVRGEKLVGWCAHYLIGIVFAVILLVVWGPGWACSPTLLPALIMGIGSVAAPFLLMQPGMGAGIAASRTPNPAAARLRSLVTHTVFGFGLYVAARLVAWLDAVMPWSVCR